jgi:hypothetical protein
MATAIPQGNPQILTLPRILIVLSVVCFFAFLAAARPVFSRVAPAATTTEAAQVETQENQAKAQPGTAPVYSAPVYSAPKPRAGKRKAARIDE